MLIQKYGSIHNNYKYMYLKTTYIFNLIKKVLLSHT